MPVVQVLYYTDPVDPWCWGLEPALRKLVATRPESLRFTYVMCGTGGAPAELWSTA